MYKAIVAPLRNIRKHPNADRLQLATVAGDQVIIGLDNHEGQMGIYFVVDGQLSDNFATANDLIRRKDAAGNRAGGFFDENRKVRAQNIRGQRSYGFWTTFDALEKAGVKQKHIDALKEGFEFDEIDGIKICNKYETAATKAFRAKRGRESRSETKMFRRHFETPNLKRNIQFMQPGSIVYITEKLHGTSHRIGHIKDLPPAKGRWQRLYRDVLDFLGREVEPSWQYVHGSRNVVLDEFLYDKFHASNFRAKATESLNGNLKKGEVIYCEIVGYSDDNTTIMPAHSVKKLGEAEMVKQYGESIKYTYGQLPGTSRVYVYRIVMYNEDGWPTELSWNQVVTRCKELGVSHVPLIETFIYDGDVEKLSKHLEELCEGPSLLDRTHIREGVCVRVDHPEIGPEHTAKWKSFRFLQMEMTSKDDETVVDIEEAS